MTSIGIIHKTVTSAVSTSETSYQTVAETDAMTAGTTYYVIAEVRANVDSTARLGSLRLIDKTNGDAVLTHSEYIKEHTTSEICESYYYLGVVTAGSDGGGIELQQHVSLASQTMETDYASIMLLDLSNMDSDDYFFVSRDSDSTPGTSYETNAEYTNDHPRTNDEFLVFGYVAYNVNNVQYSSYAKLSCTEPSATPNEPELLFEGEDATEKQNWLFSRHYTFSGINKDITWAIETKSESGGTSNEHAYSAILGLRLNAFNNFVGSYTSAETTTTATTMQEMASVSLTPEFSGDVLVFGTTLWVGGSTGRYCRQRIQVDNTTSPHAITNNKWSVNSNDGTDILPMTSITKYSGSAATAATIDLDTEKATSADVGWKNRSLAAFTIKLASGDTTHKNNMTSMRLGARLGSYRTRGFAKRTRFRR